MKAFQAGWGIFLIQDWGAKVGVRYGILLFLSVSEAISHDVTALKPLSLDLFLILGRCRPSRIW